MKYKIKKNKPAIEKEYKSVNEIYLTENDRIIYIYKRDTNKEITEVTKVAYEIKIKDKWLAIVRYDSYHGYLHRHLVIAIDNNSDTPTTIGIKKSGNHAAWLTWSINDIKSKFEVYKKGFLRRSKVESIDTD